MATLSGPDAFHAAIEMMSYSEYEMSKGCQLTIGWNETINSVEAQNRRRKDGLRKRVSSWRIM